MHSAMFLSTGTVDYYKHVQTCMTQVFITNILFIGFATIKSKEDTNNELKQVKWDTNKSIK
jgi:hypothetical protein